MIKYNDNRFMIVKALILCAILFSCTKSWQFNNPHNSFEYFTLGLNYFQQPVDHLNYISSETWYQKYFINTNHYDGKGPALLYLCGQGPCRGIPDPSFVTQIAQQTKAIIFSIEHRYYGESLPFQDDSYSEQSLKYLTAQQALRDYARFISTVKSKGMYGVSASTKWIVIGGSYAGALSAWFRAKYPHLVAGAISSSGVVLAVDDFKQFDQQVHDSAALSGESCVNAIRQLVSYAENQSLSDSRLQFQARYRAEKLTTRQFMFYWADVLAMQVQYGKRQELCALLNNKTIVEMLGATTAIFGAVSPTDYGVEYLRDKKYALKNGGSARAWYYQSCTQFSFFQTYSSAAMRSSLLSLSFYHTYCATIFNTDILYADVLRTNNQFGGLLLKATNIYMSNGVEDPWRWASLQRSVGGITSKIANCSNCGHCRELRASTKNDPKPIIDIRNEEMAAVKEWLGIRK